MLVQKHTKEEIEISMEQFLAELNKDIEWEYAAAIQYIQHAAVMRGAENMRLIDELEEHAKQEMEHADILSQLVDQFGGNPSAGVEKTFISQSKDAREMMRQDLKSEQLIIERYTLRREQAKHLRLYGVEHVIGSLIAVEQEHERDLLTALGE